MNLILPPSHLPTIQLISWLSAWLLIGLFAYLNSHAHRRYFVLWTAAWAFYAAWMTLQRKASNSPMSVGVEFAEIICIGAMAVCLMWGSAEFFQARNRISLYAAFMAFLVSWGWVGTSTLPGAEARMNVEVPIFILVGLSSLAAAAGFLRMHWQNPQPGTGLAAAGFLAWSLQLFAFPFLMASGDLIGLAFLSATLIQWFIAVGMITLTLEQRRQENQRLETRASQTEARYQGLFDQVNEAIVVAGVEDLEILAMNRAAEELFELSGSEAENLRLSHFYALSSPGGDLPNTGADWFEHLTQQRHHNLFWKDGRPVSTEVEGTTVNYRGRPAYQFIFREIASEGRLEQELRKNDRLSSIGATLTGMAHELNNPLSVIKGYLELILVRDVLPETTQMDIVKMKGECERAAHLVEKFRSIVHPEVAGRDCVQLEELIRQTLALRQYELKGVDVRLHVDSPLPSLEIIPSQIQQVLFNLIANASQALKLREQPGVLRISARRIDHAVQIVVEDNGPGVPGAIADQIFEPFFTTREDRSASGLGLCVARGIMTEHQGTIHLEPSCLGGASFVMVLPVSTALSGESAEPAASEPGQKPSDKPESNKPARVLVLDDEASLAEMVGEMLTIQGNEARVVNDSLDALKLLEKYDFDAILSDYRMPKMDGRVLYQTLMKIRPDLAQKIIYLTGDVINEDTQDFLRTCGRPVVTKPFNFKTVEKTIHDLVARNEKASEANPEPPPRRDRGGPSLGNRY